MTLKKISRSISTKECCKHWRGLNPWPPGLHRTEHPTEPPRPASFTIYYIKVGLKGQHYTGMFSWRWSDLICTVSPRAVRSVSIFNNIQWFCNWTKSSLSNSIDVQSDLGLCHLPVPTRHLLVWYDLYTGGLTLAPDTLFFLILNENIGWPRWLRWMRVQLVIRQLLARPQPDRQHSFVEIDREIFSMVSLLLIQEGQLSVSGDRMCTALVKSLEV